MPPVADLFHQLERILEEQLAGLRELLSLMGAQEEALVTGQPDRIRPLVRLQGGGPASHGASKFHREPGSGGASSYPGHIFKGKTMPGRMGGERVTVKNLSVAGVDPENNLLLIRGAVPGPRNGLLMIRKRAGAPR